MTNQTNQIIHVSLDIFQEFYQANDRLVVEQLTSRNISQQDAWKLVYFVPLAFNRILMSSSGIIFSDKFIIQRQEESSTTKILKDEPFFRESINIALSQRNYCQDYWRNIISRSVELKVINQALHAGSNIEDLLLSSPILVLPVDD